MATAARTYTHLSNRARDRASLQRKTVVKNSLDNPFKVAWPSVPQNVQNTILAHLLSLLEVMAKPRVVAAQERQKRKSAQYQEKKELKRRKTDSTGDAVQVYPPSTTEVEMATSSSDPDAQGSEAAPSATKSIDIEEALKSDPGPTESPQHIVMGINNVAKCLEDQIKQLRTAITVPHAGASRNKSQGSLVRPLDTVFVCKGDVDPPILISHLVQLVGSYNSALRGRAISQDSDRKPILIVPLAKGAEEQLAAALSVRRVATFAFDRTMVLANPLKTLLESVPLVYAPWTAPIIEAEPPSQALVRTQIKQVQVSAPKDMKAAKEMRVKGRAATKEKKKRRVTITA